MELNKNTMPLGTDEPQIEYSTKKAWESPEITKWNLDDKLNLLIGGGADGSALQS
ncbi:hypothetical protein [Aquirufa ecclesiirivi]|uniref:hypothetical protein n=1 Tax=Aquirufa ecclesiirivi TaxID=2715124 RepID=UPI0023D7C427|nr:hypothetical protein [Aquirufa ecclesiirivi]MDF0694716.1 hypothetical protein [Aquirufa ecclesiirivi]